MRHRNRDTFTTIKTEGNLLPIDLLHRIAEGDSGLKGLTPDSYHLTKNERLNEIINRACPACPARPVECETYSSGVGQNDRTGACPACPVAPEDGTGVGSGNPTGVNSSSACLLAKKDRIGRARLDLVNRSDAIPLGVQLFFKKISHKAPSTQKEGGAFLFCLPHEAGP